MLTVPADATVECDAVPAVGAATATDNCDTNVTVAYDGEVDRLRLEVSELHERMDFTERLLASQREEQRLPGLDA